MNFYRHYLGDYGRKTAHLSLVEHGAYRLLLDHCYALGKPLPADLEALCRICRAQTDTERKAVKSVAEQFFPLNGDGTRHNKRADEELVAYAKQADTNRRIAAEREAERKANEALNGSLDGALNDGGTNGQPKPEVRSQKLEVTKPEAVSQKSERSKTKGQAQAPFVLPDWIPAEHWQAWIDARLKARKAPTEYAKRLAVLKLENLRDQGYAPAQVLMQSAFNGWADLFPPKEIR